MSKIIDMFASLLHLKTNNIITDFRGGHWVYSSNNNAVIGYDFNKGIYAGYFIRFSQSVDICLLPNLENALNNHTPDLTKNWWFNPDIILCDDIERFAA